MAVSQFHSLFATRYYYVYIMYTSHWFWVYVLKERKRKKKKKKTLVEVVQPINTSFQIYSFMWFIADNRRFTYGWRCNILNNQMHWRNSTISSLDNVFLLLLHLHLLLLASFFSVSSQFFKWKRLSVRDRECNK